MAFTHDQLVLASKQWALRNGMKVAFTELETTIKEIPDVICFGGIVTSLVIEVKVSRRDFKRDCLKSFRANPETGIGTHRIYAAPKGLLRLSDMPRNWALLEINERGIMTLEYERCTEFPSSKFLTNRFAQARCIESEYNVVYSALRRQDIELKSFRSISNLIVNNR